MRTKTKAKTRSLKLPTSAAELKWYTFEEVFAEAAKKKGFLEEYHKARERLALARQVRTTRTAKRLTQAMVAKKASMPQSAIVSLYNLAEEIPTGGGNTSFVESREIPKAFLEPQALKYF